MKAMYFHLTVVLEVGFLAFSSTALPLYPSVKGTNKPEGEQKAYHLKIAANLVNGTKTPRCGVIDVEEFTTLGPVFEKKDLTYRIQTYTPDLLNDVVDTTIKEAFQYWADVTPLTFTQTTSPADIEIIFVAGDHGDGAPFDGPSGDLAHAFSPGSGIGGDAHFDEAEKWSTTNKGINLLNVATHEFGHSLGLGHTDVPGSVMLPIYQYVPKENFKLSQDDVDGIQSLYGAAADTTQAPSLTSTQAPSQTSIQATMQTSTQATSQTSTQAPSQTSIQATMQTSTQATSQTSTQATSQTSTQATSQTSTQATSQTSTQATSQTSTQATSQTSTQATSQTSTQATSQTSTQATSQTSTQATSQTSTQATSQTSTQATVQTSTQEPAACDPDLFADAALRLQRLLFFKNGFFRIGRSRRVIPITNTWPSMVSNIDAAISQRRRRVITFFSGSQYWVYDSRVLRSGYPKPITDFGLPSSVTKIDAAMQIRYRRIVFFVGNQFWIYSRFNRNLSGPYLISNVFNNTSKVDAAFRQQRYFYLVSGSLMYMYRGSRFIRSFRPNGWMNCN